MGNKNKGQAEQLDPVAVMEQIRKGYTQELSFKLGEYDCPCRILSSEEEAAAIAKGKNEAAKLPETADKALSKPIKVQKSVLYAGTTVGLTHYLPKATLDKLSADELSKAYDKYRSVIKMADPEFELLPLDEIDQMITAVKKNGASWSDFYISDLAAMGRYFLDQIKPEDKEPGS